MKKNITLLLLFTFFSLFLMGCNKLHSSTTEENSLLTSLESANSLVSDEIPITYEDGRSIVTLSIYFPSEDILQAVTAFNQSNPDYYVELLSGIGADNTPSINQITAEEYWTQETLEIFAGKGPDIFTKTLQTSYNEYVEKGVMEDLTPYINRDLNPDDYLASSLYAYVRDGKVYAVESGFTLALSVGNSDLLGHREGWTFADMQKIMQENPQIHIYQNYYGGVGTFLSDYLTHGNPNYADFDTLRSCIEFDKSHPKRLSNDEPVLPGENVLVEDILISNALDWADYDTMYGNTLTPVGFIDEQNTGVFHDAFGWSINAASKQKEGAWAFLKFLLSEEYQREFNTSRFSPLKSLLEEQFEYYSTPLEGSYFDSKLQEMVSY